MESRVRSLVFDLVKPTAIKWDVNKAECIEIHKDIDTLDTRIKNIEHCLKIVEDENGSTVFDDINAKILQNEQKRLQSTDVLK